MRKTSLWIMVLLAVVMLAGCGKQSPVAEKEEKQWDIRIRTVEVVSAVENEDHIYQVEYPYSYIAFNKEEKKNEQIDLLGAKDRDELTKKIPNIS